MYLELLQYISKFVIGRVVLLEQPFSVEKTNAIYVCNRSAMKLRYSVEFKVLPTTITGPTDDQKKAFKNIILSQSACV